MKHILLTCCIWLASLSGLFAQLTPPVTTEVVPYDQPKEYEIGGVRIVGAQYADANTLIAIAGFRVGDKIRVPGPNIPKAMNALWNLKLFTDVQINRERTQGDLIFLEIVVKELPRYTRHTFVGVKKNQHEDLNGIINKYLQKGAILTENTKVALENAMEQHYIDKGYLDSKVEIRQFPDERGVNATRLEFDVNRNKRVKIKDIQFVGNNNTKDRVLRKKMKETVRKRRLFKKSKFVRSEFKGDLEKLEAYYNTLGFRDARVVKDTVWRQDKSKGRLFGKGKKEKGLVMIRVDINEGSRYFFRNIAWKGNTIYETKFLDQVLGIKRGDVYNQELLQNRLQFSQDGRDISSLYLDNGYLFFRVDPVEAAIDNDSIDLELRIYEGPLATIDRVVIKGNDRTHEHVVRRELFTRPGDKFSRSDIIRSQRQIANLGYFNQETMDINTPVNPERGTVDIEYTLEEKSSDQLELSAGYQPATAFSQGGVIGTLGVTFNNFSLRNIKNREAWNPLPQGDGQRFSLRGQTAGDRYQSYNISFTEPWLGGKKPNSLTVAGVYNRFATGFPGSDTYGSLQITQGTVGFGTRLKVPDDNFIFRADLDLQTLNVNNFGQFIDDKGRVIRQGTFNNFNLTLNLARNTINDPIFPRSGSLFSLKVSLTPPYSLFKSADFYNSSDLQKVYRWVEYVKYRFDSEWYTQVVGKLTLKAQAKIGILSRWSKKTPLTPFERYNLGGNGLNNQFFGVNAREIISMRGYDESYITNRFPGGAAVFDKFTVELRYPISLNPQSTIFVLAFAQGGNAWGRVQDFNPFDMRRSAGLGMRVFLPMFGTLGFDYGFGFDKPELAGTKKLTNYAEFNIILGFEPD